MSKENPTEAREARALTPREKVIDDSNQILWLALGSYRPDGSEGIARLASALAKLAPPQAIVHTDSVGNLWVDNRGDEPTRSATMFCAHLDAVHPRKAEGQIKLYWNEDRTQISTLGAAVLGADDGAGVAILAALMANNTPGLYLFSQGEETGGHGMRHAVSKLFHRVEGIKRAIAFDRRGTDEICGDQCVGTLASEAFVYTLSDGLKLNHTWGHGTYTDNCEWQGIIPEIVNVSVGYDANHSKMETLDWVYFQKLREACLDLNWESLPTEGPAEPTVSPVSMLYDADIMDYGDMPRDIEAEIYDLCDGLGFLQSTYEGELIRDAISRAYRYGVEDGTSDILAQLEADKRKRSQSTAFKTLDALTR